MTLPSKKSRSIEVDGSTYRWLVSSRSGILHLTVQVGGGQCMQAYLEPHWLYSHRDDGTWKRVAQGRAVSGRTVSKIIRHGLRNGWTPLEAGRLFEIAAWEAERVEPVGTDLEDGVALRDLATEQLGALRFDLSLDSSWRRTLFDAPVGERFLIPDGFHGVADAARENRLHFAAFNDGESAGGFVVFGIESVEFPHLAMYTTTRLSTR